MNAAVITETRPMSSIQDCIYDHLEMLPDDFELIVFCGENNLRYFNNFDCQKYTVNVNTLNDYNALMTSTFYWDKLLSYERVLIFQTDSKILREGVEEFYEYDFIGAPLYHISFPCMNGGLSLRNPKMMFGFVNEPHFVSSNHNEDVLFCQAAQRMSAKLPTKEKAMEFSVETVFGLGSWGIHAADKWMDKEQYNQIINQYEKN